jgi:DNA repair exonuclease SbcCD ATPase subunit
LKDLNIIAEAVSTKKGIPVIYMNRYLKKIRKLANDLLSLIYGDEFQLAKFNVDQDTFEVPYVKNGSKIPDIKYASQSEIALATMALSFALANNASGIYNILLLDEIDAGLDEANRSAFMKMLYKQMQTLNAEQVFIISHNLSQMANVPMDCIKLSDTGVKSKLQNVIYE